MRSGHGSTLLGNTVGGSGPPIPTAYTPTITWSGNTTSAAAATFVHRPGLLFVWGSFTESAGSSTTTLTVSLPVGFTVALPSGVGPISGRAQGGGSQTAGFAAVNGTTSVSTQAAITGIVTTWTFRFYVPVTT